MLKNAMYVTAQDFQQVHIAIPSKWHQNSSIAGAMLWKHLLGKVIYFSQKQATKKDTVNRRKVLTITTKYLPN